MREDHLDLWDSAGPPSYRALWNLMAAIDAQGLGEALCAKGSTEAGNRVHGKVWRGSKRATQPGLQVITAAGHRYRVVLVQRDVAGPHMMEATVALLHETPLEGKLVSLDAGLLQRSAVKTIVQKRRPT